MKVYLPGGDKLQLTKLALLAVVQVTVDDKGLVKVESSATHHALVIKNSSDILMASKKKVL